MSGKHPLLHNDLDTFNVYVSFNKLIGSEDQTISFLEEIGLIPSRNSTPPLCCELPMSVENCADKKLKWVWRCATKGSKKKGSESCRKIINPSQNTFFDGNLFRISFRETLAIVISSVIGMKFSDVYSNSQAWRHHGDGSELSYNTVYDYFSYCREIAEVIASHTDIVLGGNGLYCKEDKTGLFFRVNSKSKSELWPYIKKYIDINTSRLCTDSANTTNDLKNQNKLLKKSIICRRTSKLLHQYMVLFWYRQNVLNKFNDKGSQIMQFPLYIKQVHPGYLNAKRPRLHDNVDEEIDEFEIETATQNDTSSSESNSNDLFRNKNYSTH
ncbi:hypothetical protein PV325_010698, partial [Microctonus aethiopoides]